MPDEPLKAGTPEFAAALAAARLEIVRSTGSVIRDERIHGEPERVVMDGDQEIRREFWNNSQYWRRA
jgi:hypothetical protein